MSGHPGNKNVVLKIPDKYYTNYDQKNTDDADKTYRMGLRNENIEMFKECS